MRVHHTAIQSMFMFGGQVYEFADRVKAEILAESIIRAPVRSGELVRSLRSTTTGSNQLGCNFSVYSDAPHAQWVVTDTPSKHMPYGRYMVLYASHTYVPAQWAWSAGMRIGHRDGYDANDFMFEALRAGLALHGLV